MLRIALTGGIATGKSYVLNRFRAHGFATLDADELAHGVMAPGTEATSAIAARFGDDMLGSDGAVDRAKLGPLVFADAAARRDLEAIVHPAVYRAIAAALGAFERLGHDAAIVDIPLLYESGHERDFAKVIVTMCSVETQMARLMERGLTKTQAERRIAAQWPTEEKAARADFVIRTDGAKAETDEQVAAIIGALASLG